MQGFGKNTASPSGEDDFFHEPEGLGLAWTSRTRVTFACGYGDSATEYLFFSILSDKIEVIYYVL